MQQLKKILEFTMHAHQDIFEDSVLIFLNNSLSNRPIQDWITKYLEYGRVCIDNCTKTDSSCRATWHSKSRCSDISWTWSLSDACACPYLLEECVFFGYLCGKYRFGFWSRNRNWIMKKPLGMTKMISNSIKKFNRFQKLHRESPPLPLLLWKILALPRGITKMILI